jgi:hypothetical protein
MACWYKWRRLVNLPLWLFLPAIFFNSKGGNKRNYTKTVSSYTTLVKQQKVYLLPVRDNEEGRKGGEEPQISTKLWVKHINCTERTLPVTDLT